jgi:hypothetical protein
MSNEIEKLRSQLREKDRELREKDDQLREKDRQIESKSLHAVLCNKNHLVPLFCTGTASTNMNPPNHTVAGMILKSFKRSDLVKFVKDLQNETGLDPKLKSLSSGVMAEFEKQETKNVSKEADVAFFVNLLLRDAVKICNELLSLAAKTVGDGTAEPTKLEVRQEMSIFSNRCDHAVVFDVTSNVPIFCVETKKHFGENFDPNDEKRSFGQFFDQLYAMRLSRLSAPLGAITCFNETYLTCLDPAIAWDACPTLESLQATVKDLPGVLYPNMTPSPLKMEPEPEIQQNGKTKRGNFFVPHKKRCVVRSTKAINPNDVVTALVVAILNAVKGNYQPKSYLIAERSRIKLDCIKMYKEAYEWGELTTTCQGPYKLTTGSRRSCYKELYLLQCIGTGSTSKAYRAITIDGYDCVVKLYVQRHDSTGELKDESKFQKESYSHVENEVKKYHKVYPDLKDYVWQQKFYDMNCVILPFPFFNQYQKKKGMVQYTT